MFISELPNCKKKCKKLYGRARKRGIPYLDVKAGLVQEFGVKSSSDLTEEQYNLVMERLDKIIITDELRRVEAEIVKVQKEWFEKNHPTEENE